MMRVDRDQKKKRKGGKGGAGECLIVFACRDCNGVAASVAPRAHEGGRVSRTSGSVSMRPQVGQIILECVHNKSESQKAHASMRPQCVLNADSNASSLRPQVRLTAHPFSLSSLYAFYHIAVRLSTPVINHIKMR